MSFFDENVNFGHFKLLLAYFGLSWPQYQCSKILISVSDLVLTGLSQIGKKILNNNDLLDKNANFGHYSQFLACFWAAAPKGTKS